jgi:hypothetical protein
MAVLDSSPRASAEVSVRNLQRLTLTDGTFFLPGCYAVLWGRASAPTGVAPEALQECGCSCKVFSQSLLMCEVLVSAGIGSVSAGLGGVVRTHRRSSAFGARQIVYRASSPRAWAQSRRALRLVHTPLRRPSAGQRGEVSTTPIEWVVNHGFLVELLSGDSSGRSCLVR